MCEEDTAFHPGLQKKGPVQVTVGLAGAGRHWAWEM